MENTEMKFTSELTVKLLDVMGSDQRICEAARVSTQGEKSLESTESQGLINFLMKNRHGTPFEHNAMTFFIKAPIAVFREFHRHRIGWCLAGDTEIWCETISENHGRTIRKRPIEWLWNNWHNGVEDSWGRIRKLASCRNFTVRTLDEKTGHFILSKVVNIHKNGVKDLLEIRTADKRTIKLSKDHLVWTPGGWKKAGTLAVGSLIGRNGKVSVNAGRQIPPSLRSGIGVWTSMQRASMIKPIDQCVQCKNSFPAKELELDHVIPVVADLTQALNVKNLAPTCKSCHRAKTNYEQSLAIRGQTSGVGWTKIKSIKAVGKAETYDLELEGPNRGFVANGLIVHNSYNESSGRYMELKPEFYIPDEHRPLVQVGKAGAYIFEPGTKDQYVEMRYAIERQCKNAYLEYQDMLKIGIAKEVARGVLPVYLYSSMYATCNARSLMSFLSLRTKYDDTKFPSFPMREIELVGLLMENEFLKHFPITWASFRAHGSVAP